MKTVNRIGVGSAFRVGAALSAFLFLVLGFFIVLLPGLFGADLMREILGSSSGGAGVAIIVYVVGTILYAIVGGIVGAIYAWLYNIAAGWVGGIEIDLS